MKNVRGVCLLAVAVTGCSAFSTGVAAAEKAESVETGKVVVAAAQTAPPAEQTQAAALPSTNGLSLNFRGVPLALVLDYLSDAAGFVINKEADIGGNIEMWSSTPVSRAEAVDLLNAALRKNGCAAIRHGRILTIVRLDNAKTADLEVVVGSDAQKVERSEEVVTQVIPVRHANVTQLLNNLQVLLPASASLSANESANTLILVASKTDIRRMLKIVNSLDSAISSVSSIKVIPLKYADAKQLATIVQQLFAQEQSGGRSGGRGQMFNMPGGFPFGPPGMGGAPGGGASSSGGSSGNAAGAKVVAVADETSNSLVVSAPTDLMTLVTDMAEKIDQPVTDITELRLFHLKNADPAELADQISQLFPDTSRNGSSQNQSPFRFGPPGFGGASQDQSGGSTRAKKRDQVLAVADARSSSLLVSAASALMPQIAAMIEQLDSNPARREIVQVYELRNANPSDVNQVLQDLFNRNSTMRTTSNNRNSQLGQNNALTSRETQQQNQNSANTGFGANFGRGGGGNSGGGGF